LRSDIQVKYEARSSYIPMDNATSVSWNAKSLQVFRCILVDEEKTSRSILEPFDCSGSYEMKPKSATGTVDIQPVRIMCSYHDIYFLLSLMRSVQTSLGRGEVEPVEEPEVETVVVKTVHVNQKLHFIESVGEVEKSRHYNAARPQIAKDPTSQHVSVDESVDPFVDE